MFKSFPFCILLYPLVKNFLEHPISSKSWSGLALSNVAAAASAAMLPITLYALLLWLAWTSGFESHEQRNVKLRKFEGSLHDIWNSSQLIVLIANLHSILIEKKSIIFVVLGWMLDALYLKLMLQLWRWLITEGVVMCTKLNSRVYVTKTLGKNNNL